MGGGFPVGWDRPRATRRQARRDARRCVRLRSFAECAEAWRPPRGCPGLSRRQRLQHIAANAARQADAVPIGVDHAAIAARKSQQRHQVGRQLAVSETRALNASKSPLECGQRGPEDRAMFHEPLAAMRTGALNSIDPEADEIVQQYGRISVPRIRQFRTETAFAPARTAASPARGRAYPLPKARPQPHAEPSTRGMGEDKTTSRANRPTRRISGPAEAKNSPPIPPS